MKRGTFVISKLVAFLIVLAILIILAVIITAKFQDIKEVFVNLFGNF